MMIKEQVQKMNLPRESKANDLIAKIENATKLIIKTVQIELHEEDVLGSFLSTPAQEITEEKLTAKVSEMKTSKSTKALFNCTSS